MTSQFENEEWYKKLTGQINNKKKETAIDGIVKDYENFVTIINQIKEKKNKKDNLLKAQDFESSKLNVQDLKAECFEMKNVLYEKIKENEKFTKNIFSLNKSIKSIEKEMKTKTLECEELQEKIMKLEQSNRSLIEISKEKDKAILILQDELTTCNLELLKLDEKLNIHNKTSEKEGTSERNRKEEIMKVLKTKGSQSKSCIVSSNDQSVFAVAGNSVEFYCNNAQESYKLMQTISLKSKANDIKFNKTDEFVAVALNTNTVGYYSVKEGVAKIYLKGHIGPVYCVGFLNNNNELVTCSHDRTIKIWDVEYGTCTDTIFAISSCSSVSVRDNNKVLLSCHTDSTVRIWDNRKKDKMVNQFKYKKDKITNGYFLEDKIVFSSKDNSINFVDLFNGSLVSEYNKSYYNDL